MIGNLPEIYNEEFSALEETVLRNSNKAQIFRTETEMRISVLDEIHYPTPASKYWQCIREQSAMYNVLTQDTFEYRLSLNKLDRLKAKKRTVKRQVKIDKLSYQMDEMLRVIQDRVREILMWQKLIEELDDGTFDTEDVNAHQLESYYLRFTKRAETIGGSDNPDVTSNILGQLHSAQLHIEKGKDSCNTLKLQNQPLLTRIKNKTE